MSYFFIFSIFIFIIGICVGSFLNVLIDRLPRKVSIHGRSHCEFCRHILKWYDLIPLVSFIFLEGKCRYCKARLSYQYLLMEILTGILFVLTYVSIFNELSISIFQSINLYSLFFNLAYALFMVSCFIVIFIIDLKHKIIPDKILVPAVVVSFIFLIVSIMFLSPTSYPLSLASSFFNLHSLIFNHLLSAIGAFLFFLFIFLLTKGRGMGFGDVKFVFLIGLFLGFPGTFYALYIAFLTGGLFGLILILWKKKGLKYAVPFGPFLVFGALLSFLLQDQIGIIVSHLFT